MKPLLITKTFPVHISETPRTGNYVAALFLLLLLFCCNIQLEAKDIQFNKTV